MAAAQSAVTVKGGPQLARAFGRMDDRLDDMRSTHDRAATVVVERAQAIAPRLTGALADSVHAEPTDTGSEVVAGGPLVPYAGVIHNGWRDHNIEPQPFLDDALEATAPDVRDRYDDGIEDVVRAFGREAP